MYQRYDHGITCIDSGYMRPQMAACYVMQQGAEAAIIETGTALSVARVLQTLDALGVAKERVRYVIPTHVHLDHAGGAGALLQQLPNATLVVHPRGARHLIDPARLIAGAEQVYGAARTRELYGEIIAAPPERVRIGEDGSTWQLAERTLLIRDTPGHARHHFCIWDERSSGWFTGDTFGIAYPELCINARPSLLPTTTPVQFEPEALLASVDLLMSYRPQCMYLTHFGRIPVDAAAATRLQQHIRAYLRIAAQFGNDDTQAPLLKQALADYTVADLRRLGCDWPEQSLYDFLALDMDLNSQGLMSWKRAQG